MNDSIMKSSAPTTPKTTRKGTRTARRTKSSASASSSSSSLSVNISLLLLIVVMTVVFSSSLQLVEGRNTHFTMEFIPTFKNGLPHKCHPEEIKTMESFLGKILTKETGMIKHSVEYLDAMYDPNDSTTVEGSSAHHLKRHHFSKVRGFDFTFDCPTQHGTNGDTKVSCPDNDWCHVLCLDETVKPGHESLTERANNLKSKLHANSKTVEGPAYNVKCLGQTSDLDLHLLVSVSPGDETSTHEEL